MTENKIGFWWRLYLRIVCGYYRPSAFHAYLRKIQHDKYMQYKLDKFSEWFLARADVQRYWRDCMVHPWRANQTRGGSIELGEQTRTEALEMFGRLVKGAMIIYIDDVNHFIFYKTE